MAAARSPGLTPSALFDSLSLSFVPRIRRPKSENIYRRPNFVTMFLSLREKGYPSLSFMDGSRDIDICDQYGLVVGT